MLTALPAHGQEQQARTAEPPRAAGTPIYDMVAGDRETAWRINRVTGEIIICRLDTTGSLDVARARCSPATIESNPQQSRMPVEGSRP